MKRILTAVAAVVLTAASAQATTFPGLTRIYVASGVSESAGSTAYRMATAVLCSNLSGGNATIRVAFFDHFGAPAGTLVTQTVANARTVTAVTQSVFVLSYTNANTGAIAQGMAVVYSTQSAVHCSAMVLDPDAIIAQGVDLHMVRYNAHPGTVE